MSLESEKCHHPGYPLLVGQSRILSVTSQGSDAQEDEKNRSRRRGGCQGIHQLTERAPRELVGKGIGHRGRCDFHSRSASKAYESFYLYTPEQMTMGGSVCLTPE